MARLILTVRLDDESQKPKGAYYGAETETVVETLCDIREQHMSKGMIAAALRQLADEVDPPRVGVSF